MKYTGEHKARVEQAIHPNRLWNIVRGPNDETGEWWFVGGSMWMKNAYPQDGVYTTREDAEKFLASLTPAQLEADVDVETK